MTAAQDNVKLPPRPLVRTFWSLHKLAYRLTGGRFGLQQPERGAKFGMLRLHTVGRRSGQGRVAMIGYFEDGTNLVTLAMNGWGKTEPAWWLNLQSTPAAAVDLADGSRTVRARAATGAERDRLWAAFQDYPGWGTDLDALTARRPREPAIVVFEPAEGTDR
jgi:deazaflavin-dependent oxidoreductase (nitroreductase family)